MMRNNNFKKLNQWQSMLKMICVIDDDTFNFIWENWRFAFIDWLVDIWDIEDINLFWYSFVKFKDGTYNVIDQKCNILWDKNRYFDTIFEISNWFLFVEKDKKFNFIKKDGTELVKSRDYKYQHNLFSNGFCVITNHWKDNFIDERGNVISTVWFDYSIDRFEWNYARCENRDWVFNFISNNWILLFQKPLKCNYIDNFYEWLARIELVEGNWNYIDVAGKFLLSDAVNWCSNFINGYWIISKENDKYLVDIQWKIYWPYDDIVW